MRTAALFVGTIALTLALCEVLTRELIVVRDVGPSFSEYDPFLGRVHKKAFTTIRRTPEFTMRFTSNSLGYRGPEPRPYASDDEPVVLCLGDSFTEGYGVNDGEEFPRLLDAQLAKDGRRAHVINAGVGDTGTGRALRFLRRYGTTADARHPTVLVYEVAVNDFSDNETEALFTIDASGILEERTGDMPRSSLRRLQPLLESIPVLSESYLFAASLQAVKLHSRVANPSRGSALADIHPSTDGTRLTVLLEDAILSMADERRWPTVVVTVALEPEQRAALAPVFLAHHATVIAMPSKAERPDLHYRVDGHWNRAGHTYAAAQLLPVVERQLDRLTPTRISRLARPRHLR